MKTVRSKRHLSERAKSKRYNLDRRDRCNLFRLWPGHMMLNMDTGTELKRCSYNLDCWASPAILWETHWSPLFTPPKSKLENCLFSNINQLKKTTQFHMVESEVRQGIINKKTRLNILYSQWWKQLNILIYIKKTISIIGLRF